MVTATRKAAKRSTEFRITEDPALYGLVVRERGQFVEYVSYGEAARRTRRRDQRAAVAAAE